jgi:hypothetical protein
MQEELELRTIALGLEHGDFAGRCGDSFGASSVGLHSLVGNPGEGLEEDLEGDLAGAHSLFGADKGFLEDP